MRGSVPVSSSEGWCRRVLWHCSGALGGRSLWEGGSRAGREESPPPVEGGTKPLRSVGRVTGRSCRPPPGITRRTGPGRPCRGPRGGGQGGAGAVVHAGRE